MRQQLTARLRVADLQEFAKVKWKSQLDRIGCLRQSPWPSRAPMGVSGTCRMIAGLAQYIESNEVWKQGCSSD